MCKTLLFLLKPGQTINLCVWRKLLSAASAVRVLLYKIRDPVLKHEKRENSHSERQLATVAFNSRSHSTSVTAGKKAKLSIFSSANTLRNIIKGVKMLERETVKPV